MPRFTVLALCALSAATLTSAQNLKSRFADPPREYSMEPLWSWNGTLTPEKLTWQIDQMVEKGVYGAYMHARVGLDESQTPYFSEGFWNGVRVSVEHGSKVGFKTWLYDEDKWPSGDAGGRTRAANPERYTAQGLAHRTVSVTGPASYPLNFEKAVMVMAARKRGAEAIDPDSVVQLSGQKIWQVPAGEWLISVFEPAPRHQPLPNYLNPDAVREFLNNTYEQYAKHVGAHFGTTIPGSFFDEIYNIRPLPWDPLLEERFRAHKGYELRTVLPLIFLDGGPRTIKARCDYYSEFTRLYEEAWFKQISEWCARHNLIWTGHTNEDIANIRDQGDYFRTQRHLHMPGTDNEDFRSPVWPYRIGSWKPKQLSSISHVYGKQRAMVEALGGPGWTVTLDQARYGISMLAVYGINSYVMHLFHYTIDSQLAQDDYPCSWFYQNPYWKYFKTLADYTRRLSFMGSQGEHVAAISVLYPVEDVWTRIPDKKYPAHGVERVSDRLVHTHRDFDMVDTDSVAAATPRIGTEDYRVLILPDVKTVSLPMYRRLAERAASGLRVVALVQTPRNSAENGADDPEVIRLSAGISVVKNLDELDAWLAANVPADVTFSGAGAGVLRFLHRRAEGKDFYLLVNSERRPVSVTARFAAEGGAELWDPATGRTSPMDPSRLSFEPWQAYYVVFDRTLKPATPATQAQETVVALNGPWKFQLAPHELDYRWTAEPGETRVEIPVADFRVAGGDWQRIRLSNTTARYVSDWKAQWVTWNGYKDNRMTSFAGDGLTFSKEIEIPFEPAKMALRIEAQDSYECLWDGQPVTDVKAIPATKGRHKLEIRVHGKGYLLAEGAISGRAGERMEIRADKTWTVKGEPAFVAAPPPASTSAYPVEVDYRIPVPPGCTLESGAAERHMKLLKPGDGLNAPVAARCGKTPVELGDWSQQKLDWYSGRALYSTTFEAPAGKRVTLDLGELCYTGEVWVNGQLAGTFAWPPYHVDITKYLRAGNNQLTVVAANLLANEMRWNRFESGRFNVVSHWWHDGNILREPDKLRSGLVGPVTLRVEVR